MSAYGTCASGCTLSPYHAGPCVVTVSEEKPSRFRIEPVDKCVNTLCPNRVGEGKFVLMTIFVSEQRSPRDISLALCAPCAEYLARRIK